MVRTDPATLSTEIKELMEEGLLHGRWSIPEELEEALKDAALDDDLAEDTLKGFQNMSPSEKHATFELLGQL